MYIKKIKHIHVIVKVSNLQHSKMLDSKIAARNSYFRPFQIRKALFNDAFFTGVISMQDGHVEQIS